MTQSPLVIVEREGDVGIVSLNSPPVNALGRELTESLNRAFAVLLDDAAVHAIVLVGHGKMFCGGANIKEFVDLLPGQLHASHRLNPLFNKIEEAAKPVIAAIHGACLGGGLEMAMACHYRVGAESALVGQPEVKLGLIPGAGGTQRLPRLVGLAKAATLCAFGNVIRADEALASGILDKIAEGDSRAHAIRLAHEVAPRPTRDRCDRLTDVSTLADVREQIGQPTDQSFAPLKAIEAIETAARLPFVEGLRVEAELFEECLYSDQSRALIRDFLNRKK
jgi:3-hydroxyacyl-CoA dehydrogenase